MYEEAINLMLNGSFFSGVNILYTIAMDQWWKIILFLFTLFITAIVTKNESAVALIGIVGSSFLAYQMPGALSIAHGVLYIIILFSLSMLLYKASGGGE